MGELQKMFGGFRPHNIDPIIRIAHRTKVTAPTVLPGEIVLIAHPDLDSVAAEGLVRAKPSAIINCAPFVTGKYPNQGPKVLLSAGIPIYESDTNILDSIHNFSCQTFISEDF
jgi:uncharacterized membrane-anchored protein